MVIFASLSKIDGEMVLVRAALDGLEPARTKSPDCRLSQDAVLIACRHSRKNPGDEIKLAFVRNRVRRIDRECVAVSFRIGPPR